MEIECTKFLLDKLKIKAVPSKEQENVYSWHVNIFKFGRAYLCLMTNNELYFPVIAYPMYAKDFKNFQKIMENAILEAFYFEDIPFDVCKKYLASAGEWNYTKTHSRKIIGVNNEQMKHATWQQKYIIDGRISQPAWSEIVAKMPLFCSSDNCVFPYQALKEYFKSFNNSY